MTDLRLEEYYNACISQIINNDHRQYSVGFVQHQGVELSEEWIIDESIDENGEYICYDYNLRTKVVKITSIKQCVFGFCSFFHSNIDFETTMSVLNNGMQWEGVVAATGHPFGYGSLYNSSNELVYQGVMIGDKKECFGIEFYPGLDKIEYIGCYYNNERHGFGKLYDRKGELLYEGDWLCGSNEYERNVILKDINNERMVHSLIHELIIDEGVGKEYKGDLFLCGFAYLERLVVKSKSFQRVNCLKITDNCVLKSIDIEDGEMYDGNMCTGCFTLAKSVVLSSSLIYD